MDTIITPQNPSQLLTAREMASLLQLNPETVRRACKAGKLPHIRIGGTLRFSGEHIEAIFRDGFQCEKKTN